MNGRSSTARIDAQTTGFCLHTVLHAISKAKLSKQLKISQHKTSVSTQLQNKKMYD
jgi:hypothetical protein